MAVKIVKNSISGFFDEKAFQDSVIKKSKNFFDFFLINTFRQKSQCFESGKMNIKIDACRSHFQDTMNGRFVVGFVALIILSEIKYQLSKEKVFSDKKKKSIPAHYYTMTDVIDITRGITINYAKNLDRYWVGGAIKEVKNICLACGLDEDLYNNTHECIKNIKSIITN